MLIRTSETFVLLWQYNGRYCRYSRNAGDVAGEGEILCFYGAFVIMKIQNFFLNLICIYGIRREYKVDEAVVLTVAGVVNSKIDYSQFLQKGEVDMMCSVFEETWQDGLVHGKTEGKAEEIVQMGNEFGLSEEDIVERLQKKLGISLEKAQEYLSLFRS